MKNRTLSLLIVSLLGVTILASCGTATSSSGNGTPLISNSKTDDEDPTVTSFIITSSPKKIAYKVGDKFDATGMKFKAVWSDGEIETDLTISDCDSYTPNGALAVTDTKITFNYETASTALDITVTDAKLNSLTVSGIPTTCFLGEVIDLSSMKVIGSYSDNTESEITEYDLYEGETKLSKDKVSFASLGDHTLTVKVGTVSADSVINVSAGIKIEAENIKLATEATAGEAYLEKEVSPKSTVFNVINDTGKADLSSGLAYVGDVREGQVLKFHFNSTVSGKADIIFNLASTFYSETDGSVWHPLAMKDMQVNQVFTVKANDVTNTIADTVLIAGTETKYSSFDFAVFQNWKEINLGEIAVVVGDNIIELDCISTYHTPARTGNSSNDWFGVGCNIDMYKVLFK